MLCEKPVMSLLCCTDSEIFCVLSCFYPVIDGTGMSGKEKFSSWIGAGVPDKVCITLIQFLNIS